MNISTKGKYNNIIELEEYFRAPKSKVFQAWTKPDSLKKWFMADEGVIVTDASVELCIGGNYFIETLFPGNEPSSINGEFLLVDINHQLVYSWNVPLLNGRSTKVNVVFTDLDNGSKINLTHAEFQNEQELQMHIFGWKGCISHLQDYLNTE